MRLACVSNVLGVLPPAIGNRNLIVGLQNVVAIVGGQCGELRVFSRGEQCESAAPASLNDAMILAYRERRRGVIRRRTNVLRGLPIFPNSRASLATSLPLSSAAPPKRAWSVRPLRFRHASQRAVSVQWRNRRRRPRHRSAANRGSGCFHGLRRRPLRPMQETRRNESGCTTCTRLAGPTAAAAEGTRIGGVLGMESAWRQDTAAWSRIEPHSAIRDFDSIFPPPRHQRKNCRVRRLSCQSRESPAQPSASMCCRSGCGCSISLGVLVAKPLSTPGTFTGRYSGAGWSVATPKAR